MALALDGLSTGLDTTSLISQLMQAEAGQQRALQAKVKVAQTAASAYRSVNTRFDALRTAAEALTKPEAWTATKATVTGTNATASASAGAQPGQLSFHVRQLARTHSVISGTSAATSTEVATTDPVTVTVGTGDPYTVVSDGSLAGIAKALNDDAASGVRASVVNTGSGFRLMVTARESGAAGTFTLDGLGATPASVVAGQDARIALGADSTGAGGLEVTSASNTFKDLVPGLSVTVTAATATGAGPTVIDVTQDTDSVVGKVKALVEAANAALTEIDKQATNKPGAAGPLGGDSTLRSLRDRILSVVNTLVDPDGTGPAQGTQAKAMGLELTRDGRLTFTEASLRTSLTTDLPSVRAVFTALPTPTPPDTVTDPATLGPTDPGVGFAQRLLGVATAATKAETGTLTTAAQGRENSVKNLESRIEDWDRRLVTKRNAYERTFGQLEVSIGRMKSQSSWLAGALNSLPSWS